MMTCSRFFLLALVALGLLANLTAVATPETSFPTDGLHENPSDWYALVGGRVVVRPGTVLDDTTIVVRDGQIVSVGSDAPAGAKQIDLNGKIVYPGFIESFSEVDIKATPPGPQHWNKKVTPQRDASAHDASDPKLERELRQQGFTARLMVPKRGVIKGTSCLSLIDGGEARASLVADRVATHLELTVPYGSGGDNSDYPNSPMGAVALARQALLDADWHRQATAAAAADPSIRRPEANVALERLAGCLEGGQLVIAQASNEHFVLRADRFAREFALRIAVRGSGNEYRRLDEIAATDRSLIVPVDFPKPPAVASPDAAADATLEALMHWRLAPENPARLRSAGVTIALTSHGLKNRDEFLQQVRKAVSRGLSAEDALAALTTAPAELLGVANRIGTIEKGKLANLIVVDGDLFTSDGKVVSTWVAGKPFEVAEAVPSIVGTWKVQAKSIDQSSLLKISGKPGKLKVTIEAEGSDEEGESTEDESDDKDSEDAKSDDAKSHQLQDVRFEQQRLTGRLAEHPFGIEGELLLAMTIFGEDDNEKLVGTLRSLGGKAISLTATRHNQDQDEENRDEKDEEVSGESSIDVDVVVNYPLGTYGRTEEPKQPKLVLFRNATVWTCGEAGRLDSADVLVREGLIEEVAKEIDAPADAVVVDASGKHLTPGIIDCHSHMATDGGLNEWSQAVTAEVRIEDFLDPDDPTIYRQLAGGVTSASILHGSANPIGGQNTVIKLRWGCETDALRFDGAPAGIKFALGENVKQSNWGDNHATRYPQTRMGVDEIMIDAFQAAKKYADKQAAWKNNPVGPPPRRDLELEAIAEIVAGERWIHCHSYRQSEIITLLRTLERFDIKIGSLQHILEGYKVAPEMAAHGAMASTFADWWAYKYEVYDAIPYNGAMMHEAGIVVSFNSDNNELGRHLNHEAAKAVKYGGVPPEEALKFVTLNPAKQLRIDQQVGSIEAGKQADLVLWDGPPLSIFSKCEQTWIDGQKFFDREQSQQRHAKQEDLRQKLVQAVIDSKEPAAKPGDNKIDPATLWPRHDEFCHGHDHGAHQQ